MRRNYLLTTLFLGLVMTIMVGFTLVGPALNNAVQAAPSSSNNFIINEEWTYTPTLEFDSGYEVDYEFPLADILTPTHFAVEPLRGDDYISTTHPGLEFPVLAQQGTDWWGKFVYELPATISHTQEGDLFGALLLREIGEDAWHHWYTQSYWPGWGTSYSDARLGEQFIGGFGAKNCIAVQSPIVPAGYELGYCVIKTVLEDDFQPFLMFETSKGNHTATLTTWKCNFRVEVQDQRCPIPARWLKILFPERGVSLSMDQSKVGLQGDVVTYSVILTNTGGYTDTFLVNLNNVDPSWYTWMTSQNPTLAAGQSVEFEVSVLIPADANAGASDVATVSATSQGDTTVGDSTLLTTSIPLPPPPEGYILYIPLVVRP